MDPSKSLTPDPDGAPVLHFNPRLDDDRQPDDALRLWLESEPRARGHHLFQTSGTTGTGRVGGRWVALSSAALTASAAAVNHHLRVTPDDHWMVALPTFHVGGFGILVRAHLAGSALSTMQERWRPESLVHRIQKTGATLTSLVPTQVNDLVSSALRPPDNLRAVLVGGGRLEPKIHQQALELGWPLLRTYGATETASQVATESVNIRHTSLGEPWLPMLPCWEVRLVEPPGGPIIGPPDEPVGQLELRGPALFSGYVERDTDGGWTWVDPLIDGWWRSSDVVQLRPQSHPEDIPELSWRGRVDRVANVLGELVHLDQLESRILGLAEPDWSGRLAVIQMPQARAGAVPVLVAHMDLHQGDVRSLVVAANRQLAPFERIQGLWRVEELPRTSLGKTRHAELERRLREELEDAKCNPNQKQLAEAEGLVVPL